MLSTTAESTADPIRTVSSVGTTAPPVAVASRPANTSRAPTSTKAPTRMNRPTKKSSVSHSTSATRSFGAQQRDHRRRDAGLTLQQEPDQDQDQDHQAAGEHLRVGDGLPLVERHQGGRALRVGPKRAAEHEPRQD